MLIHILDHGEVNMNQSIHFKLNNLMNPLILQKGTAPLFEITNSNPIVGIFFTMVKK